MSVYLDRLHSLIIKDFEPKNIFPPKELLDNIDGFEDKLNAVNLCILCEESLLFIKRSDSMPSYSGHIAFLGGHLNPGESFLDGALREFEEETGVNSNHLEHLGYLKIVLAKSYRPIIPLAFKLKMSRVEFLNCAVSNGEWVDIFWVDLPKLIDLNRWRSERREYQGRNIKVHYFDLAQEDRQGLENKADDYLLWGATGRIVYKLAKNISRIEQEI
jgi:8-oxo-dGTP pyrophosphatase MutT (NUDIX family)